MPAENAGATRPESAALPGKDVLARNSEHIGRLEDVLLNAGDPPRDYAIVQTGSWLSRKQFAVPLELVTLEGDHARLKVEKRRFSGAPEWRDGDMDFYRFHNYWQPPLAGGSETVSDADVLIGEEITGTQYSGTDLDSPAERAANTMRAADAARHHR